MFCTVPLIPHSSFPHDMVFRIFDNILATGVEALFGFQLGYASEERGKAARNEVRRDGCIPEQQDLRYISGYGWHATLSASLNHSFHSYS
jgi:hypothetical protein